MSTAIAKKEAPKSDLATYDYGQDAGLGFAGQTNEDGKMPYLVILQALTPEISKPSQKIPGAEVGMLMNSVSKQLYDGKTGVIIQPCATSHTYKEWKPRKDGGGLANTYSIDDPLIAKIKAEQEFGKYKNGKNDIVETFDIAALIHESANLDKVAKDEPQPVILTFTKTKISAYRTIMARIRQLKGKIPLFAHRILVTSFIESNSQGDFGNFILAPLVNDNVKESLIPPSYTSIMNVGRELCKAFESGKVKGNDESVAETSDSNTSDEKSPF